MGPELPEQTEAKGRVLTHDRRVEVGAWAGRGEGLCLQGCAREPSEWVQRSEELPLGDGGISGLELLSSSSSVSSAPGAWPTGRGRR